MSAVGCSGVRVDGARSSMCHVLRWSAIDSIALRQTHTRLQRMRNTHFAHHYEQSKHISRAEQSDSHLVSVWTDTQIQARSSEFKMWELCAKFCVHSLPLATANATSFSETENDICVYFPISITWIVVGSGTVTRHIVWGRGNSHHFNYLFITNKRSHFKLHAQI